MTINDVVYFFSYSHSPLLSFLKFPNETKKIDECETIVVSQYSINSSFISSLSKYIHNGYKVIIDNSAEILGLNSIEFILSVGKPENVTVYANSYETSMESDVQKIIDYGANVIIEPFFISCINYYQPTYTNEIINKKEFLLLCGKSKPTRTSMVGLLSYYDLIKYGHVSFFGDGVINNKSNFFRDKKSDYFDKTNSPDDQKNKVRLGLSKLPSKMILDVQDLTHSISHGRKYNGDYYDSVNFVIVVESDIREGMIFITEKTMKCVQQNKKFILFASSGSLSFIKNKVKLYLNKDITHLTDWCDTSYDNIKDKWERLDKIVNIVKDNIGE